MTILRITVSVVGATGSLGRSSSMK